jgi:hypothetical protein
LTELRATGFPDLDEQLAESLLAPVHPGWPPSSSTAQAAARIPARRRNALLKAHRG